MRKIPPGAHESAGCAVVRFQNSQISKFGCPNDEAWAAIPRTKGLDDGGYEVLNSGWNAGLFWGDHLRRPVGRDAACGPDLLAKHERERASRRLLRPQSERAGDERRHKETDQPPNQA
jgi:hypothetical protein